MTPFLCDSWALNTVYIVRYAESPSPLGSPAMGHWDTCPPRLTKIYFFQCTLTYTKSDNDYMLTVASCKHPLLCPSWHQILATPLAISVGLYVVLRMPLSIQCVLCKKEKEMKSIYIAPFIYNVYFKAVRHGSHSLPALCLRVVTTLVIGGCHCQMYIFRVRRGPFQQEFYQCVTFGAYTARWQEQLYSTVSLLLMYIIPLVTMVTAYLLIFITIARKSRDFLQQGTLRHASPAHFYRVTLC